MSVRNKIFVSYSHKDKKLFEEFKTMIAPAIEEGAVDIWDDTRIPPGAKWEEEIEAALAAANVAVLLVSPNFLASHFIANEELPPLLKAAQDEGVSIFWFYLSSCLYERTEIATYQAGHNISTPLDRLSKPERQAVLSEACHKLIQLAETKKSNQAAVSGKPIQTRGRDQEDQILNCCLRMKYAVDYASIGARGGGPSTMLHRRLDLASKWVNEVKGLVSSGRVTLTGDLSDAWADVQKVIPWLIQEARWASPKAGEDKKRETMNTSKRPVTKLTTSRRI